MRVTDYCGRPALWCSRIRVCAEEKAQFGFHQAFGWQSARGSQELWDSYPAKVRARLGKLTPETVWIKGERARPDRRGKPAGASLLIDIIT